MTMSDIIAIAIRQYRMQVVAHRLRKFGFEPSINKLAEADLSVLATMLYPHQAQAIHRELSRRATSSLPASPAS
jgi:hypothetical protein